MSEQLYALGSIDAADSRIGVYDSQGEIRSSLMIVNADLDNYEASIGTLADTVELITPASGEVVAASVAVAAQVTESGELTGTDELSPWTGKYLKQDLGSALALPKELVGTPNNVVAIALSQQYVNSADGKPVKGIATTLGNGWGAALYSEEGEIKGDEPGHQHLRQSARCPCGGRDHVAAFISGKGVELNHGKTMQEWLASVPDASEQLTIDITTATVAMLERHKTTNGFEAEEVRWTGGIALGRPLMMLQVAMQVQKRFGPGEAPTFGIITKGRQASLHGTFIDAQRRAQQH
jgi:predicted NBD/HSP70 family sugar kinase